MNNQKNNMRTKRKLICYLKITGRYLLIALGVIFFVLILSFILSWRHWQQFSQDALRGKDLLAGALTDIGKKDWPEADVKLEASKQAFTSSSEEIDSLRSSWFLAKIGIGRTQLDDLDYLNDSALIISSSALQATELAENLNLSAFGNGTFRDLSPEKKAAALQSLIALEPELNGLKANINLAIYNLDRIHTVSILWPLKSKLLDMRNQLASGELLLDQAIPILRLIPAFSGYPEEAHYLIMLQNNDELRPTGGFLGSYVRVDLANFGEIKKIIADDVYHLDMPSIGIVKYEPPIPINRYMNVKNWYLRDANWSPSWPQSARLIQEMFKAESTAAKQNEPELDGVLAITPEFVADLLRITGPITVRGESYAPENMQALLQYNVEIAYKDDDISSWDRKDIINELIAALKDKLMNLPLNKYYTLAETITDSTERGDLLMYFNNPGRESAAAALGADGEIKAISGDYLMVVDANLAAFKSDSVMDKTISYNLKEEENGLQATVRLNYQHNGGYDWRTTKYRSYTRILAPQGSELISIDGLNAEETDTASYEDEALGKHVFAFFWSIEPGKSRNVSIKYTLPDNLKNRLQSEKVYTLYVQRQPGSRIKNLNISLKPLNSIQGASPSNINRKDNDNEAHWTFDLEKSQNLQLWTN